MRSKGHRRATEEEWPAEWRDEVEDIDGSLRVVLDEVDAAPEEGVARRRVTHDRDQPC